MLYPKQILGGRSPKCACAINKSVTEQLKTELTIKILMRQSVNSNNSYIAAERVTDVTLLYRTLL